MISAKKKKNPAYLNFTINFNEFQNFLVSGLYLFCFNDSSMNYDLVLQHDLRTIHKESWASIEGKTSDHEYRVTWSISQIYFFD